MLPPRSQEHGGFSVDEIYKLFPNLEERSSSQGTKLSGGEQQMLAIARILRTGPSSCCLTSRPKAWRRSSCSRSAIPSALLREQGFTILLVEQNFRFAATVADRHYVVEHGRVIDMIPNSALEANKEKLQTYLGV